ncbi:serine hydrolase domain-containing protein [Daejeonella lutea]|uniref:CubicO group peptidase, beta-lactamase class C family n=1 Tax=Daejeonella lutea TaxID=572036 RepID=A0A1T5DBV9_9SPHI|nr:serine hydrolase [Daejeonella lutea]SKB69111.1 CubicO group peptidase, beta-lactamase class C family [Daejeonella lutea]
MKIISSLKFILFLLLTFTVQSVYSQYYPGPVWQSKNPSEVKMNAALVDSAVSFALKNDSKTNYNITAALKDSYKNEPDYKITGPVQDRGKPAGMIIRNGYIVAQWGDINRVDMTFSTTKSYLSTMAGLALDKGLLKNVNEPVIKYIGGDTFKGDHNSKITWSHLLTQSSDWSGCLFGVCDWADRPVKYTHVDELKTRKFIEPGTNFEYNDVRVNLLAYSLLKVWKRPLPQILKEHIMDPIGASDSWKWYGYENSKVDIDGKMIESVSGGGHFGGGLFINTQDHARFGLLFLRNGRWNDQQLISEDWVGAVQQPSAANKSYGYMWWLNAEGRYKDVPANIYTADGFGGNFIVVDKDRDVVIVARWLEPSKLGEMIKKVIASVE